MSSKPPGRGHNSGDTFADPGPANDYFDRGAIAQFPQFDRVAVSAFYNAVRSQGDDPARHRAIDLAFERARECAALSSNSVRLYHRICQNCHGSFRYSTEPHERLAGYCSFPNAKHLHKYINELLDLGFLARFSVARHGGGHPFPVYTVVCTADDRSGLTAELLRRRVLERKLPSGLPSAFLAEGQATEHYLEIKAKPKSGELQPAEMAAIPQNGELRPLQFGSNSYGNTPNRGLATPQIGDLNLRPFISEGISTVEQVERGCGGDTSPPAQSASPTPLDAEFEDLESAGQERLAESATACLKPRRSEKNPRGARLPETWWLTNEEFQRITDVWQLTPEQALRIVREFKNYWLAVPGRQGCKTDWKRVLINRLDAKATRRGEPSNTGRAAPRSHHKPSIDDISEDVFNYRD